MVVLSDGDPDPNETESEVVDADVDGRGRGEGTVMGACGIEVPIVVIWLGRWPR